MLERKIEREKLNKEKQNETKRIGIVRCREREREKKHESRKKNSK